MIGSYTDRLKTKIAQHELKLAQLQKKHSATCDMTRICTKMKYAIKDLQNELRTHQQGEFDRQRRLFMEAHDRALEEDKERKRQLKLKQERQELAKRVLMQG